MSCLMCVQTREARRGRGAEKTRESREASGGSDPVCYLSRTLPKRLAPVRPPWKRVCACSQCERVRAHCVLWPSHQHAQQMVTQRKSVCITRARCPRFSFCRQIFLHGPSYLKKPKHGLNAAPTSRTRPTREAMAVTSTDNQTAAAPIAEVPVASKTASPPADEIEPAPTETSKPASRQASAPAAAYKHSRPAPRAACAPPHSQHAS